MRTNIYILLICLLITYSKKVFAQNVPPAGQAGVIEKSYERKRTLSEYEDTLQVIEWNLPELRQELPSAVKVTVNTIDFEGNTVVSSTKLKSLLKGYLNRSLTIEELGSLADTVTAYYRRKGYFLARAYIPPQDIKGGRVVVELTEGKLGRIGIKGARDQQKVLRLLEKYFQPARKGVLHYKKLLKAILLINEYTSLELKSFLQKGEAQDTVDVILAVKEKKSFSRRAAFDNYGSRFVAKRRASIEFQKYGALISGDEAILSGGTSVDIKDLTFASAQYAYLLNKSGTRASLAYYWLDSNVQREFRPLDVGGRSNIYTLSFSQPLIKTITTRLDASLSFSAKEIENYFLGTISSNDKLRILSVGINGERLDRFQGRNFYSFLVSVGIPDILGGLKANDSRASRIGAGGRFRKLNLEAGRMQRISKDIIVHLRAAAQFASDVLPASEQFTIGGANSVRGYPQSEFLGDLGSFGSVELRFPLPFLGNKRFLKTERLLKEIFMLTAFIDHGRIRLKHPLPGERKTEAITGTGGGLLVQFNDNFQLKVEVGVPVGAKEPSDGSSATVYVQSIIKF